MNWKNLRTFRWVALYALVGLVVYVVALMICFPYGRVKDMAVAMAAQAGYEAEIGSAGPAFPFGVSFGDIRLRSRAQAPLPAQGKPIQLRFDSAEVPFLPIVLSGGSALDVVLHGLGGRIALSIDTRKGGPMHHRVRIDSLNLGEVPGARQLWNLPLTGALDLTIRLDSKTDRFVDANGEIEFKCVTCTVGDGKSAVKFGGGNPFLAAGLTLPRVRLGDFGGRIVIEKGVARAQGVAIKSADAELTLEGELLLRDPVPLSVVNAYLRFKLGEALLRNASAIASVLQVAGAPGLRPDGFYGLRMAGALSAMAAVLTPNSPVPAVGPGRGGARSNVVPSASTGQAMGAAAAPPSLPGALGAGAPPPPPVRAPGVEERAPAPAPVVAPPSPAPPAPAPPPPVATENEGPAPASPEDGEPQSPEVTMLAAPPIRGSPARSAGSSATDAVKGRMRNPPAAPPPAGGVPEGAATGSSPAPAASSGASPPPPGLPDNNEPILSPPE